MTEQRARELATQFVSDNGIKAGSIIAATFQSGKELQESLEKFNVKTDNVAPCGDHWLIRFASTWQPPPDEIWGDDVDIIIEINDKTGAASQFR